MRDLLLTKLFVVIRSEGIFDIFKYIETHLVEKVKNNLLTANVFFIPIIDYFIVIRR
jgi:hypothetical protein